MPRSLKKHSDEAQPNAAQAVDSGDQQRLDLPQGHVAPKFTLYDPLVAQPMEIRIRPCEGGKGRAVFEYPDGTSSVIDLRPSKRPSDHLYRELCRVHEILKAYCE
jgi:hypothetical protein